MGNAFIRFPDRSTSRFSSTAPQCRAGGLKKKVEEMASQSIEVPLIIGGAEVRSGQMADMVQPHKHSHVLGRYTREAPARSAWRSRQPRRPGLAGPRLRGGARRDLPQGGGLLAGEWRWVLNAATMLCQSKTVHQAEVDSPAR